MAQLIKNYTTAMLHKPKCSFLAKQIKLAEKWAWLFCAAKRTSSLAMKGIMGLRNGWQAQDQVNKSNTILHIDSVFNNTTAQLIAECIWHFYMQPPPLIVSNVHFIISAWFQIRPNGVEWSDKLQ